ncbi:hypothetical protein ACFLZB_02435, partial [Nanoarchaeota archaeon]
EVQIEQPPTEPKIIEEIIEPQFAVSAGNETPIFNTTETQPQPGTQYNQTDAVPLFISIDENATVFAEITLPDSALLPHKFLYRILLLSY